MIFFDEYANILRGMYNGRFDGDAPNRDTSNQDRTTLQEIVTPLMNTLKARQQSEKCSLN
jgi:hypothetical protein